MPPKSGRDQKSRNVVFSNDTNKEAEFQEQPPSTTENVISVILGLAVVLVIGAMIFNAIRNRNGQGETSSTQTEEEQQFSATVSATHTVQPGETLWSIAEKYYQDGFQWTQIQKANNLAGETVEKDTQLFIPKIEGVVASTTITSPAAADTAVPTTITTTPAPETEVGSTGPSGSNEAAGETISLPADKKYAVVTGDTLWDISVRFYGNGYRWGEIAQANSLVNPDIIHPGNILNLP